MKKEQTPLESKLLLGCCAAIVGLHFWAALQPSHLNWGVHFFAFYNPLVSLAALGCVVLVTLPSIRTRCIHLTEQFIVRLSRVPLIILFGIAAGILFAGGYYFASQLHLLGDGILLLRSLSLTEWGSNIISCFNNQPLMYWIARTSFSSHLIESPEYTYSLYAWIDRIGAIIFLGITFWFLRTLSVSLLEKILLGCFLFFGAGSQFFFGYIENYVLQYVITACFAITGWFALERKVSMFIPMACFVIMIGLHLGNLVFLPSPALLLLLYYKKYRVRTILIMCSLGVTGFLTIYFLGYLPSLLRHFTGESVDFLQPFSAVGGNFPYPMFSLYHLIDWLNLQFLVAPFGIIITLIVLMNSPNKERWNDTTAQFLLLTAGCGLLFTWIINTALGMARDWDLLSGFLVPLMVLNVYLIAQSPSSLFKRNTMFLVVVIMMFHWGAWIGVNANETRHLNRIRLLTNPSLLSLSAQLFCDETLANYFFDHKQYADAQMYYEHSISIDPNNRRIIGNIADVYRHLGEKEKYFHTLQRAAEMKSPDPGIYSNLGVEYATRKDTDKAIEFNERAVEMDSLQAKAHANLGLLYVTRKQFPLAQQHFIRAVNAGLQDPFLYKYAADLSLYISDFGNAVKYYDGYLRMRPNDTQARSSRERAVNELQHSRK
jgi:hypothetical protein